MRWPRRGGNTQHPTRRSKPQRPGAPPVRHRASLTTVAGTGQKVPDTFGPTAVDRRPTNPKGEVGLPETVQSTGGVAEQASNTARGTSANGGVAFLLTSVKP